MAFIRRRLSSNHRFYGKIYSHQLVETYREGGKVKQRVLANLGGAETIAEALEWAKESIQRTKTMGWIGKVTPEQRNRGMAARAESIAKDEAYIERLESLQKCSVTITAQSLSLTLRETREALETGKAREEGA